MPVTTCASNKEPVNVEVKTVNDKVDQKAPAKESKPADGNNFIFLNIFRIDIW